MLPGGPIRTSRVMKITLPNSCVLPSLLLRPQDRSRRQTTLTAPHRPSPAYVCHASESDASDSDCQEGMELWDGEFFNRKEEMDLFTRRFRDMPSEVLIIVGQKNTGTTELLQRVFKRLQADKDETGKGPHPILYLDCRACEVSTPEDMAESLSKLAQNNRKTMFDWFKAFQVAPTPRKILDWLQPLTVDINGVAVDASKAFAVSAESPLKSIIESYIAFFEAAQTSPYKPVLVIDAADSLLDWEEEDPNLGQLKLLLEFFVKVTKQKNLAHVVLATSDSFLLVWLETMGLDRDQSCIEIVGNLATEEDARLFIEGFIKQNEGQPLIDEETGVDMWPQVYEICGGNMHLLRRAALASKRGRSWEAGLLSLRSAPAWALKRGLSPQTSFPKETLRKPPAWTADQYKTVLRAIVDSEPYHAVLYNDLSAEIGEVALLSLVEWNLVAIRPYSDTARDLPIEAFGNEIYARVVVTTSPVDLYTIKKMAAAGEC